MGSLKRLSSFSRYVLTTVNGSDPVFNFRLTGSLCDIQHGM